MKTMQFSEAADDALAQAMRADPSIIVIGEDTPLIRRNLLVRFGPERIRTAPISESAFLGAAVSAAMTGLRPLVELYMIDFLAVAMDAVINHAAKVREFSGGHWNVPLVIRAPCGGGYGDGGQHEQSLWGWLGHIPGIQVVVPSTPADAGGLIIAALESEDPVIYLEHKLLSEVWLEFLGSGGRKTVSYDVPPDGRRGPVPDLWKAIPIGEAILRRDGQDVALVSVGVGVHRALTAAKILEAEGISAAVLDLRSVAPLDINAVCELVSRIGRIVVIDEDYEAFGLSGELAAVLLEAGIQPEFSRVCTQTTIPYARYLENQTLPNVERICASVHQMV